MSARSWLYARIALTVLAFAALFHFVPLADLLHAAARIAPAAWAGCFALALTAQLFSVARFQLLLSAYGAEQLPPWRESLRLFLVSSFYNTYVPGGVAGDVVRALVVRKCFPRGGLTSALAVSLVERVTGLAGMLVLVATVSAFSPLIEGLLPFSLLGLLAAITAIAAVIVARRLAPHLPGRLRDIATSLPSLEHPVRYALALAAALVTHVISALGYHVIIHSLSARANVAESLVIVPIATSAQYIPATIAGAGTRDAAFVFLYERVGVEPAHALAMSLAVLLCSFVIAALGGIATLLGPYE
ncbi:MAG TPA: lysylphosphatidylglycerol synthase transmembrane domain-containing protein [Polyangiales bacterium]|nr:lysylphosphatidylglycerol synthase transmembrane domain-containing protein [Polyangiales bacterium]